MIETPQEKQIKLQNYRQCYSTDNNLNKKGKEENFKNYRQCYSTDNSLNKKGKEENFRIIVSVTQRIMTLIKKEKKIIKADREAEN
jgi:hypothetical protein